MTAFRTNIDVAFELRAIQHRIARGALHPQPFRYRPRTALGLDPRGHDFLEPSHSVFSIGQRGGIYTRSVTRRQGLHLAAFATKTTPEVGHYQMDNNGGGSVRSLGSSKAAAY